MKRSMPALGAIATVALLSGCASDYAYNDAYGYPSQAYGAYGVYGYPHDGAYDDWGFPEYGGLDLGLGFYDYGSFGARRGVEGGGFAGRTARFQRGGVTVGRFSGAGRNGGVARGGFRRGGAGFARGGGGFAHGGAGFAHGGAGFAHAGGSSTRGGGHGGGSRH